jgi:nitrite reductase (NADH) large subunit
MTAVRKKLVLVGNGMAGVRTIEHLLKLNPEGYEVTIFGSEPYPNYNRIMLSSVLAGGANMNEIIINDLEWYHSQSIKLYMGHTVTSIDSENRKVYSDKGVTAVYDELILATGSNPFILPIPGADKEGVIAFRDIKDCQIMQETAGSYKKSDCHRRWSIRTGSCERSFASGNGSHCGAYPRLYNGAPAG